MLKNLTNWFAVFLNSRCSIKCGFGNPMNPVDAVESTIGSTYCKQFECRAIYLILILMVAGQMDWKNFVTNSVDRTRKKQKSMLDEKGQVYKQMMVNLQKT